MSQQTLEPLFAKALQADWAQLPAPIHALHEFDSRAEFQGFADVERGRHPLARLCLLFLPFPKDGIDTPLKVIKTRNASGETWQRLFRGQSFTTHLRLRQKTGRVTERFGPLRFEIGLRARNGAIRLPVRRGWFLGIPLPRFLLPKSEAREYVAAGEFRFDIALYAPLTIGLLVRYRGFLAPAAVNEDIPQTN